MTDIYALAALLREQEKAAKVEQAEFTTWTEADIRKMLTGEGEADRLMRGEHATLTAGERAEVARLAALAAEESQK
ncbi:hypothetical protein [Microbacterium sp. LWH13-1.2]|uniref:hypothetical protein n=1 Tax=Microbacterium sp. LWH13-1.2 TaxID=3135260 RepID=UPI003138F24C